MSMWRGETDAEKIKRLEENIESMTKQSYVDSQMLLETQEQAERFRKENAQLSQDHITVLTRNNLLESEASANTHGVGSASAALWVSVDAPGAQY